jgi:thiosulfate/3-mercaptopyruvate sulfurtransferase
MPYNYPYGEGIIKWVSTEWLEENLNDRNLTILDTQPDIHDYIMEHIRGAVYLNSNLFRVPFKGRPGLYVDDNAIKSIFRRVGLNKDIPVVVYTGVGPFRGWGDGLEQTMIAYTLARFGHDNIYVLDGGIDKWKAENRPVTKEFPTVDESNFSVKVRSNFFLDMEEVRNMKEQDNVILLDARPQNVYEGQGPWIKPGHIPGALNLPWRILMDDKNSKLLKSEFEIKSILNEHNVSPEKTVICSCGTGREATNEFILFKWYFDFPDVKIYEGSFTEWSSYPENPTVTGKNPR